jgi:hypothetical protein
MIMSLIEKDYSRQLEAKFAYASLGEFYKLQLAYIFYRGRRFKKNEEKVQLCAMLGYFYFFKFKMMLKIYIFIQIFYNQIKHVYIIIVFVCFLL